MRRKTRKGSAHVLRKIWGFVCVLAVALLLHLWNGALAAGSSALEITILHTNNVSGHLFGCPT